MSSMPPLPPLSQPYRPPPPVPPAPAPPVDVSGPAIGLMVTAVTGGAFQLLWLLIQMLGVGVGSMTASGPEERLLNWMSGGAGILSSAIGLVIAGLIIYAALEMRQLRQWGLAVTASVLAMVPCISPCCILGLPFGIWSLSVLTTNEVKAAFR